MNQSGQKKEWSEHKISIIKGESGKNIVSLHKVKFNFHFIIKL